MPLGPTILGGKQDDVLNATASSSADRNSVDAESDANEAQEQEQMTVDTPAPIPVQVPQEVTNALMNAGITGVAEAAEVEETGDILETVPTQADSMAVPAHSNEGNVVLVPSVLVQSGMSHVDNDRSILQSPVEASPIHVEYFPAPASNPPSLLNTTESSLPTIEPRMCTVVAPANLQEGYTFTAQVDGIDFAVTVPTGGIQEGQAFSVPYPDPHSSTTTSPPVSSSVPRGHWKYGLYSCLEVIDSGLFWQGCCCTALLLGQVMTRSKLNVFGIPIMGNQERTSAFVVVAVVWGVTCLLMSVASLPANRGIFLGFWGWIIFSTILISNTRYSLRQRYRIPVRRFQGCEGRCDDICYGCWCSCCSVIQMARQTHPGKVSSREPNPSGESVKYPYVCCSPTGLSKDALDAI